MDADAGNTDNACRTGSKVVKGRKEMKVLYKRPGFPPVTREIENSLEDLQRMVGGYIEVVRLDDILIIVNEEGKNLGLPPNFYVEAIDDMIVGPAVFVRSTEEESASIGDNDAKWICNRLGWRC